MFERFGVGAPSPFGVRGGVLAVGVHAAILAYGIRATTGGADSSKPYTAPGSIWVLPAAPPRTPVTAPGMPNPGRTAFALPGIPALPSIPGTTVDPGRFAMPVTPIGTPAAGDPNGVYDSNIVEQSPELLASPPPRYPEMLRMAHVEGIVIVQGVVDTLGHLERGTLKVISSPHPALSTSAVEGLANAVFRPGRVEGRAVRVLVQMPVQFSIARR